jgi:hypothetical protein
MKLYHSPKGSYAGTYIHAYIHFYIDMRFCQRLPPYQEKPQGQVPFARLQFLCVLPHYVMRFQWIYLFGRRVGSGAKGFPSVHRP